ncbi:DUF4365 domain-containing protein [uncultured Gimesia sp.]|uniref:DUF4365 domain-containing protein n=1 Tax=uncultured Gimesia sp. TaxID=1678688 RepID=UPI00262F14ED|nr:DUF4365 domain-containing protein [uncultured Gimesia sp.]
MPRPESHRIDERAKRIFGSSLQDSWVPREQHPDYRIDYTIEIFNGDDSTGLFWHAQLKGVKNPSRLKTANAVSFSMEVDHLEYFIDKVVLPVFLVVVDTTKEEVWWVFLQHYINSKLKANWREQSSATIRLPLENSIHNSVKLQKAISDATQYMRELYPSSIAAALSAEKNRMESLDPRFEIDINATQEGTNYSLKPKEKEVCFKFHFKGENSVDKAKELIESGGKVDFSDNEVEVEGMVKEWVDGYELVALKTTQRAPVMIRFSALDELNNQRVNLEISGDISCGSKRGECTCELSGGLMKVVLPIDIEKTQVPIKIEFDISKWDGIDVKILPHLDTIYPFFELVSREPFTKGDIHIEMEVFVLGNRLLKSTGDINLTIKMQSYSPLIMALFKARTVAKELGIDAIIPNEMGPLQVHEIEVVFGLLKHKMHTFPTPKAKTTLEMPQWAFKEQIDNIQKKGAEFSRFQGGGYPFLSTAVDLGFQKITFSAMTMDESQTVIVENLNQKVVLVAEENCTCTLRQCTEPEIKMLEDWLSNEKGDS